MLWILLTLFAPNLAAQSQAWTDSIQLYEQGQYGQALDQLRQSGANDAHSFYNLGNIHYRLGQFGLAYAHYEKANQLKPHDSDIQHNLALAQSQVRKLIGNETDPASTVLETLSDRLSLDELRGFLGLAAFLLVVLWLRPYLKTRSLKETISHPAGAIGLGILLITASLYFIERLSSHAPPAIAIKNQIIRSGPGDQFLELAQLEPGIKIRLTGPSAEEQRLGNNIDSSRMDSKQERIVWLQIRYLKDAIGWVPETSLLRL